MYDSRSEILNHHKTPVDDNNQYREYVVYAKDGAFVVECIEWRIKSETRQGGNPSYSQEFSTKEDAIAMCDELLAKWEPKD